MTQLWQEWNMKTWRFKTVARRFFTQSHLLLWRWTLTTNHNTGYCVWKKSEESIIMAVKSILSWNLSEWLLTFFQALANMILVDQRRTILFSIIFLNSVLYVQSKPTLCYVITGVRISTYIVLTRYSFIYYLWLTNGTVAFANSMSFNSWLVC